MTKFKDLVGPAKAKRKLSGVHFDWDNPELTYTSPSQGGAASLKNDAYLFKANKAEEADLDDEQRAILKEIGEEFIPLQKSSEDNESTPSSSDPEGSKPGEETKVNKGNKDNMSDENMVTREEFESLQKALAVEKAVNSLTGYSFEAELSKSLASAIASLSADEDKEAITKALDTLVERGETALTKAKEDAVKPDTDLQKALDKEDGNGGTPEDAPVEKTFLQKVAEHQAKAKKGAK